MEVVAALGLPWVLEVVKDVEACGEATPLTGALRPGCCKLALLYPGISALRTSGPPLDHGAQRGGLLLTPRRASSNVSGVGLGCSESVVAQVRDPIGASSGAEGADGGSTGLIQIIGSHCYDAWANSLAMWGIRRSNR